MAVYSDNAEVRLGVDYRAEKMPKTAARPLRQEELMPRTAVRPQRHEEEMRRMAARILLRHEESQRLLTDLPTWSVQLSGKVVTIEEESARR